MKYRKLFLFAVTFFLFSCTNSMQISQKINGLIKEKKITTIIIENHEAINNGLAQTYKLNEVIIENQFIEIKDNYLNLDHVTALKVTKKSLSITF